MACGQPRGPRNKRPFAGRLYPAVGDERMRQTIPCGMPRRLPCGRRPTAAVRQQAVGCWDTVAPLTVVAATRQAVMRATYGPA